MKHTNLTGGGRTYASPTMETMSVASDTSFAVSMNTAATHEAYSIDEEFNW